VKEIHRCEKHIDSKGKNNFLRGQYHSERFGSHWVQLNSASKTAQLDRGKQNGGERNQTLAAEPTNHLFPTHCAGLSPTIMNFVGAAATNQLPLQHHHSSNAGAIKTGQKSDLHIDSSQKHRLGEAGRRYILVQAEIIGLLSSENYHFTGSNFPASSSVYGKTPRSPRKGRTVYVPA
jgi:hypothetical protein